MGSPIPFKVFKHLFERYDVKIEFAKGSHLKMQRVIQGVTLSTVAVVHHNEVLDVYLKKARKALRLTPRDGVNDDEFFS